MSTAKKVMATVKGQLSGKERARPWYHYYCFCKMTDPVPELYHTEMSSPRWPSLCPSASRSSRQ